MLSLSFNFNFKKFKHLCLSFALGLFFICTYSVFIFFAFSSKGLLTVNASAYTTYIYAQVKSNNVCFYSSISSSQNNVYFVLPQSYCVLLLSNINESFYKAQYRDMVGYVLKSSVVPVKEVPTTPYLQNISFRVYSSDGANMFSSPTNTNLAKIIEQVALLENLDYYGEIEGDEFISNRGSTWVYAKNNKTQNKGYLYKGLCDNFSYIPQNTQTLTPLTSTPFENDNNEYLYSLISLTPPLKALLITLVCLPALIIIYLLFKPFKNVNKTNLKNLKNKTENNSYYTPTHHQNNFNQNSSNIRSTQNNKNNFKNKTLSQSKTQKEKSSLTNKNISIFEKIKNFFKLNFFSKNSTQNNKTKTNNQNKNSYPKNYNKQNKTNPYSKKQKTLNKINTIIDDELL